MTHIAKKVCKASRCNILTTNKSGYCSKCQGYKIKKETADRKAYDKQRNPLVKKWLNSARYKNDRKYFLNENPLCACCQINGVVTMANTLDHIKPHKGNYDLFWDKRNWQSLCKRCHDIKTATFDGGFGNKRKQLELF
jgi:5-methylcytosine-specific restriction protein A